MQPFILLLPSAFPGFLANLKKNSYILTPKISRAPGFFSAHFKVFYSEGSGARAGVADAARPALVP